VRFRPGDVETYLNWPRTVRAVVRDGREVVLDPARGLDERVLRAILIGPVLAVLLQQRGLLVLHASCVAVGGQALVLAGGLAAGKSTLARALLDAGFLLVADDVTAIDFSGARAIALPGPPGLRLKPAAAQAAGDDPTRLPIAVPGDDKILRSVAARQRSGAAQLEAVYILGTGREPSVRRLSPAAAMIELVRHSYWPEMAGPAGRRRHFEQCAELSRSVHVRRLTRTSRLADLPRLVSLVTAAGATDLAQAALARTR